MAQGYSGDKAVTLPNFFPSPGEAMTQAIGVNERQKDRDFEVQQYNQRLQQQNRIGNLNYIDDATAFDKFKVGQQAIDNYSLGKLQQIQQKALTQYANLDPAEMRYRIQQDLAPLTQWDTMAKTQYSNIEKSLQDLNKTYPNINLSKAYDLAMNQFAQDFMQKSPDGSWSGKNYMELQGKDYRQLFENPDILGQIVEDESPFVKAIQGVGLRKVGGKEVVDNKGNVQSYKWAGELSPFAEEIIDEKNRPTDRRIKAEIINLPNGQKIEMLPIEETKQLLANPAAKAAAYSMWNKVKPSGLDENTNDRLFRSFLHDQVKRNDLSYIKQEEIEKTPRPPSNNFFFNNGPQSFNPETSGTVFDRIGETPVVSKATGVRIQDGMVMGKDGNPYTTESGKSIFVPISAIPAGVSQMAAPYIPEKLKLAVKGYEIRTENGRIVAVKPSIEGGENLPLNWITRQDAWNAQLKDNTESPKGQQPSFGNVQGQDKPFTPSGGGKPKGVTLKGTETPSDLKVGQLYILDGTPVIWNGKNLVKQK